MRIKFNKALLMGGYLLWAVTAAGVFTACNDDDDPDLVAIASPTLENTDKTVSSLTFNWSKVANATQYSYELTDPQGDLIDGDVTVGTTASFTGLKDNTTYTLSVWAYSAYANGVYGDAPVAVLTATTDKIVPLDTPQNLRVSRQNGNRFTIQWDRVNNAASYSYTVTSGETVIDSRTSTRNECNVNVPGVGDYVISVYAISNMEAYSDSEEATLAFTRERIESWRTEGQFSAGGYTWNAYIVAYDDSSYAIESWYGYEGYDLEFTVDSASGEIVPSSDYECSSWSWWTIPTSEGYVDYIYTTGGYSSFTGNKNSGSLNFWSNYNGNVTFVWPVPVEEEETLFIDQLVGTYNGVTTGGDYFASDWSWQGSVTYDAVETVATKVDNTHLLLTNFVTSGETLTLTVDNDAKTVIVEPQTFFSYYTFTTYNYNAAAIDTEVGYDLEAGTITIPKDGDYSTWNTWSLLYNNYQYAFYVTTMTKK